MSQKSLTIKEVALKNNCPECFNTDGLKLTFKQRFKETAFYRSITQEVSHELSCNKCGTTIYPIQWTEDIERVVDYQKKAFTPRKVALKYKKLFWILLILIILLITSAILVLFFY